MDLGIAGRKALLCASSRGLGYACAQALAREGVIVTINGRNEDKLRKAANALSVVGEQDVSYVVGDVTTDAGRAALLESCPAPDILLNNNAGPSAKQFPDTEPSDWRATLDGNMIAPILLIHAVLPGMIERKFGRIVNITSAMVKAPKPHHTLSAGARAGLTASLKALSLDVAKHNVTINNMLPERFDTHRQEQMARAWMKRESITYEQARALQVKAIAANRLGRPEEFGAAFAFLCSAHAGYISGQNLHLDGGSYPALL
ncbi:MAG: SDR family oxidoreductase [Proteobacteria bacterium]|nr:SDR family oxidoreductase [Pseudomonadota bacterium]MYJ96336.1 SDR family oxidoreductase [Pseudomonadota bacterium]